MDALSYIHGPYFALAFRRGITHGLPAHLLLPLAVFAGVLAWDRWVRRRRDPHLEPVRPGQVLLLSFLGVATHPILDWLNVYGMRWCLPFSGGWSYGDTLFIIDPWLWLLLGGAVLLTARERPRIWILFGALTTLLMLVAPVALAAKVVWGVGAAAVAALRFAGWPRSDPSRRALARGAVGLALFYIVAMSGANALGARDVHEAAVAEGLSVVDVMLSPVPANPFVREVEVVVPHAYVPGEHNWLAHPRAQLRPLDGVPFLRYPEGLDRETAQAILAEARLDPDVRSYLVWARYPYAEIRRDGGGWLVRYSDARYDGGDDAGGLGGITVRVAGTP